MKKNFDKRFFIFGIIFLTIFTITLTSCSSSNKVKPLNQNAKNYEISGENGSYMFYSFGKNFFNDNKNALSLTFGKVTKSTEVTVAFLFETDFKGSKLISKLPSRNTCNVLLSSDADYSKIDFGILPETKDTIKG